MNRKQLTYLSLPFFACLVLNGCSLPGKVAEPQLAKMPQTFNGRPSADVPELKWETIFNEPQLKHLIDTALQNNYDLKTGMQRVLVAGAQLRLSKGALLPGLHAQASGGLDRYGNYTMNGVGNYDTNFSPNIDNNRRIPYPATPDYFAGFRSSWELDIWGKLSKRREAAYNRLLASKQGVQWFRTQLISEVAGRYFDLAALDKQAEILTHNVALQQKAVEIVEAQLAGGRATSLAVKQFRAQLLATQGRAYEIRQTVTRTENELNNLLGRYPEAIQRDTGFISQAVPRKLFAGVPAQVVLARPDVRQAEFELKAARADVSAARKALLPSLTLDAYAGYNSFKLPLLFSPGSLAAGFLGGLTAPVFNRGVLKNGKHIADAEQMQAFYNYQRQIINAYQEVSTQLTAMDNLQKAYELKTAEVKELNEALATANDLYLAGYASYLEVIVAQGSVLNAEMEQVNIKRQSFGAMIALYRALGG
ncbi:RND transporter [Pedobacter yulinensis]|uniref:RND transporter n=1 Tax=Pedobacter yulinensis TaxID=2126353 RepID=A0A2T3HNI9_9SPHI|nr:efflux transporter outer membrane subunit [Pedobacter yulinensis]PST83963.1 RND transporter [Pedobacter yulinensis]